MDESLLLNLKVANQALYNTVKYQVSTGAQGPEGPTGAAGSAGPTGPAGANGSPGYTGPPGTNGIDGSATNTGATGRQGTAGANGIQGATGSTGPQGEPGGPTGYRGPTGDPGPPGSSGSGGKYGVIKVPSSTANFNFTLATSSLPSSFGTFNPGSATDAITFTITLNGAYSPSNLPFYNLTAYVYSTTAGYINCQRQLGAQSGVAAASITMNASVTTITFNYINKTNFPYTSNDSNGYALYICFNILN
jgi:hypothetical protein